MSSPLCKRQLPGGWGLNPQLFSQPPNTLSNYVQVVSYILYTYDLHHNFVWSPTVEKFNPPANFSSNTAPNATLTRLQRKENKVFSCCTFITCDFLFCSRFVTSNVDERLLFWQLPFRFIMCCCEMHVNFVSLVNIIIFWFSLFCCTYRRRLLLFELHSAVVCSVQFLYDCRYIKKFCFFSKSYVQSARMKSMN